MRVLMATMKLDIGGAETHIVELSKALARRGMEVFVASNGGAYEAELAEAGIRHFKVPFHSKNPAYMRRSYQRLKEIIFQNQIDVVHAHARIPAFLCARLQKRYHFRFVTTAHWVFSTRFPYNILTRWGDRSLAVSDDIKSYLVKNYGIAPDNIRVTINGIDTAKFSKDTDFSEVAREFDLKAGKWRIVYVSRMDTDRSLAAHKLIEIARDLDAQIPNLEIVIVGGGNDYNIIQAEAETVNHALNKRLIITTGSRTDINQFIASGNIFIGVSRAALEAMAAEKPSIIAGNEGYIGIFDHDKLKVSIDTNFCCRGMGETTAQQLRKDILTLYSSSGAELERLGLYARHTVSEYYSIDTMADDAMKLYVSIIKNSRVNQVSAEEFSGIDEYLAAHPEPVKPGEMDVMISGYYGFNNSGDDSILKAIVESLRRLRPEIRIVALSNNPEETERIYGVEAIHRFNIPQIYLKLRKTKLLLSGGGSLIQDITSDKSLTYYLGIIRLALMTHTKVMLYANGIGPIQNKNNYKKIRKVLSRVDLITLREQSSYDELQTIGVAGPPIHVTADPAFTLVPAGAEETESLLMQSGLPQNAKFFGIAIRPWKTNDPHFEKNLAEVIQYTSEKYGLIPLLIPMQCAKDTEISQRILNRLNGKGCLLGGTPSPSQLMGVVGRAEFILGMRLHTLIYAVKMDTPVIGLIYDPKVKAMMDYVDQKYTVPVENLNPMTLERYIDDIVANRAAIAAGIQNMSIDASLKADENAACAIELLR